MLPHRALTRRDVLSVAVGLAGAAAVPPRPAADPTALVGQHRALPGGRSYWLSGAGDVLVIGLHGSNLTAANCNVTFWAGPAGGWQTHAQQAGYVLALAEQAAAPQLASWNVGGGWVSGGQDDVAYLLGLVADATRATGPFTDVYIAGFSAGGAMAWRAVAERPDVFTAAGSASGWAPAYPAHPVDVLHYHGTADTSVPIRGGPGVNGFTFPAASLEAERAPRGSRVVLYATAGAHAVPGWAAADLWRWWTADRLRP